LQELVEYEVKRKADLNAYKTSNDNALSSFKTTTDARILAAENLYNTVLACHAKGLIYSRVSMNCVRMPIPGTFT
jgi:hypothetical protein